MTINKNKFVRFMLLSALLLVQLAFFASPTEATKAGCDDAIETYYECILPWGDLDKEVTAWCQYAKTDKEPDGNTARDKCLIALVGLTERRSAQVDAAHNEGGNVNDPRCYQNDPSYDKKQKCWGYIKQGEWKNAIATLVVECGLPPEQDASCATRVKKEFLHDMDWADDPGKVPEDSKADIDTGENKDAWETPFMQRVATYLQWIFVGVGVLAVFGLIISAIQYGASQDNPQSVAAAKTRIINIIYGAVIFAMMFGLLQWLVPGGLF